MWCGDGAFVLGRLLTEYSTHLQAVLNLFNIAWCFKGNHFLDQKCRIRTVRCKSLSKAVLWYVDGASNPCRSKTLYRSLMLKNIAFKRSWWAWSGRLDIPMGQLRSVSIVLLFRSLTITHSVNDRLSSAERVILIGHGPGAQHIMEFLHRRCESSFNSLSQLAGLLTTKYKAVSVMRSVKAIVQIVGHSSVPATPR